MLEEGSVNNIINGDFKIYNGAINETSWRKRLLKTIKIYTAILKIQRLRLIL